MRNPICASAGSDTGSKPRRLRRPAAALAAAVALQWAVCASAATTDNWTAVASAFWNTSANWTNASSGHSVPAAGDVVNIVSSDLTPRAITYDYPGPAMSLASLTIDQTGAATTNSLSMAANALTVAGSEIIGNSGRGAVSQTGGTNTINTSLLLAQSAGTGTYTIGGGTLQVNGSVFAGGSSAAAGGAGIFNINTGGTVNVTGTLKVWNTAGSAINLAGGSLTVSTIDTNSNAAHFNWTGGALTYNSALVVDTTGPIGSSLTINSSKSLTTNAGELGYSTAGIVTQTGGSAAFTVYLDIGESAGSNGSYYLSGGSVTIGTGVCYFGNSGTGLFSQTGGTLNSGPINVGQGAGHGTINLNDPSGAAIFTASSMNVGVGSGSGTVDVASGTMTVTNTLSLMTNGAVNLSGGILNVGSLANNGSPTKFTAGWSGGTLGLISSGLTMDSIAVSPLGSSLALSGSQTLNVAGGDFVVANTGTGSFTQIGADTLTVGTSGTNHNLIIASAVGSTGSYIITKNTASATINGSAFVGGNAGAAGGAGTLNVNAGSMTITGTLKVWNTAGSAINLAGGSLNVGSIDTSSNPAHFNWTSGAFITNSALTIDTTGPIGSSLTINALKSLTVNSNGELGNTTAGVITQTGGSAAFTDFLDLGEVAGSTGSYNLSGGSLTVGSGMSFFGFGGTGLFNQTGGTLNSGPLFVGNGAGYGNFTLNDPSCAATAAISMLEVGQGTGAGTVAVTNGTMTISGTLTIDSNGTVTLSGGTLAAAHFANPTLANFIWNSGQLLLTGAEGLTITASGPLGPSVNISSGKILNVNNTLTVAADGFVTLAGGTFDNGGQTLINNGSIVGYGTIRTGGLTNNNIFTLTGGTSNVGGPVTNAAGKTLNIKNQPATFTGNITNNGTVKITGTTVTFTGTYTGNAYISDPATNIFQNNVTIVPGGSMTGGPGDVYNFSGANFTNNGTFTNGGTLVSSDPFTNTGSFTQSGLQGWSTGTTFTNTAGTAAFASDAGSVASSPLSMLANGGTVHFVGAQHLNALTVGSGTLAFDLLTPGTSTAIVQVTGNNGLTLNSGSMAFPTHSAGVASLGYYKLIQYSGSIQGSGLGSLTMPAIANNVTYTLSATQNPGFVDVHRGLLGDANDDGVVNFADFVLLSNNFTALNKGWGGADFNNDGVTNFADFVTLSNNFGGTIGANEVAAAGGDATSGAPEPASLVLLGVGLLGVLGRRRTRPSGGRQAW